MSTFCWFHVDVNGGDMATLTSLLDGRQFTIFRSPEIHSAQEFRDYLRAGFEYDLSNEAARVCMVLREPPSGLTDRRKR